jgi:dienelactone hydrolase
VPHNPAINHAPKQLYQAWSAAHPPSLAFAVRHPGQPVAAWQAELRRKLSDCLGEMPGYVEPVAQMLSESDQEDHLRQKWVLQTEANFWQPFFLLVPKKRAGRVPAVIALHGHGPGKSRPAGIADSSEEVEIVFGGERDYGLQAVRQGFVAFCPDMRGFGECVDEDHQQFDHNQSCAGSAGRASMLGRSLLGERVWDVQRAVDYLCTRPDVDLDRIVCLGQSGGGTVTLLATALEPRIAVAVVSGYLCSWQASIYGVYHCPCNYVPSLARYADCGDIGGLIAPRPALFVAGADDPIFPIAGVRKAFETVRAIYQSLDVEERADLYIGDGEHRFFKKPVWPFVQHWLGRVKREG